MKSALRMDDLQTILQTLTLEDQKEFSLFVKRHKDRNNRKDLELFRLLVGNQKSESERIIKTLYPEDANAVAYYALRKRLMQHLADFVLLKQIKEDQTAATSIRGMLSLAGYMFGMQQHRTAWNVLKKAERAAQTNHQFDLLNLVYNLQIEWAASEYADPLGKVLEKWKTNKAKADEDERANIAASIIAQKLNEIKQQDREISFESLINKVLQEYALTEVATKSPRLLFKLMSIARSAILVKKEFYSFEPYIISQYSEMEQKGGFLPAHQAYKAGLLYMIAQTLYRNRKFTESLQYLEYLSRELASGQRGMYQEYYPRYVLLSAANHSFLQEGAKAVALTESLLANKQITLTARDQLNARFNLSFYYFQQGLYKKANQQLLGIHHSDKWCEKRMGREWMLKKHVSELILQYEMGNIDLALNKARSIERSFGDMLRKDSYKNVGSYLQLVRQLIDKPGALKQEEFNSLADRYLHFAPAEQEDIHFISFYAWLKSKMLGQPYGRVLADIAGKR
jgi:hypothetical protein